MSDINQKLLERIAIMEQKLADAVKPAPAQAPQAKSYDYNDPVSTLPPGTDLDHLTKILVARAMGDQAPFELRALATQGPQLAATRALESRMADLANKVTTIVETSTKKSTRDTFKAATADKTKYPALAKALAADPDFFTEALDAHSGSVEDFAAREEAKLIRLGYHVPPTASEEDADTTGDDVEFDSNLANELGFDPNDESVVANGQSEQAELAAGQPAKVTAPVAPPPKRAPVNGRMPPLNQPKVGVFTPEDNAKLINEIVRKHSGRQQ